MKKVADKTLFQKSAPIWTTDSKQESAMKSLGHGM